MTDGKVVSALMFRKRQIGHHRDIGHGRPIADQERAIGKMAIEDLRRVLNQKATAIIVPAVAKPTAVTAAKPTTRCQLS